MGHRIDPCRTTHIIFKKKSKILPENESINTDYITHDQLSSLSQDIEQSLSIIHFNCRSMKSNFDNIDCLLERCGVKFSIMALSETWMNEEKGDDFDIYHFKGYSVHFMNRKHKKGGGTALYIKDSIKQKCVKELTYSIENCFEVVTVEIQENKGGKICVVCIYRPPNVHMNYFIENYNTFLEKIKDKKVFICGDFNIDIMKSEVDYDTNKFLDLVFSFGQYPLIVKPTRITSKSSTTIDNIYTNILDNSIKSKILIDDTTDHLPVMCVQNKVEFDCTKELSKIKKRKLNSSNIKLFNEMLEQTTWCDVYSSEDVNCAYKAFMEKFTRMLNKCCPLVEVSTKKRKDKPWLTKGLINACRKKNYLYKCQLEKNNELAKKRYLIYKNRLTAILRKAQKQYYVNKLAEYKGNMKYTWSVLNDLTGRGKRKSTLCDYIVRNKVKIYDENEIANTFNDFYINIGPKLANDIDCSNVQIKFDDYIKGIDKGKTMFVSPTTEVEIINLVSRFSNKTSEDVQSVCMKLIKNVIHHIVKPYTYICNLSLMSGIFPDDLKVAKVLPLYKSGILNEVSNYRPVSILPQLSTILEKLFEVRLRKYIDKHEFLFKGQYGFRTNHSTNLALNEMVNIILNALDNKMFSLGVFIDLKKAFDTVDHRLLVEKFKYYGIRGVASQFLESYLSNRLQFVQFKDGKSSKPNILCGVPQGSILGPLLFILYINDMFKVSDLLHFIIFADDTNIFYLDKDPVRLVNTINNELNKLTQWFKVNKLSLNVKKSNYMLFSNRKVELIPVKLNSIELERVTFTKFLGVIIDDKFSWIEHIKVIKTKVSKAVGAMFRVRDKIDETALLMIYNTLLLSHLQYCCELWGNTYGCRINDLIVLQKRAVRLIDKATFRAHTSKFLRNIAF